MTSVSVIDNDRVHAMYNSIKTTRMGNTKRRPLGSPVAGLPMFDAHETANPPSRMDTMARFRILSSSPSPSRMNTTCRNLSYILSKLAIHPKAPPSNAMKYRDCY
eukprot:Sspe_Gene.119791::Locus_116672_Transcript_1_1_Confidence_1.000_Length_638::g.119791::m.119791